MSKASPAFTSFNSGEFSPMISGRIDYDRYKNGCEILQNFIPTVQGPALQRGGTRHVALGKVSALPTPTPNQDRIYLQPFVFSETTAYVLEFGHQYIRFYTNSAQLQSAGVPVEVATPYTQTDLFNSDGTCRLRFAQSGDFLYITHPSYQPRILKRTSATSFVLDLFEPKGGPFIGVDPDNTVTVYASNDRSGGGFGLVTLTASSSIFVAAHVGTLFLIESRDSRTTKAWEPHKNITSAGDSVGVEERISDNKVYRSMQTGTTGSVKPVHFRGDEYDGDNGVLWRFLHAGYGIAKINSVTSGTVALVEVMSRLPVDAIGAANATTRWSFSEWSSINGWPTAVSFFRERLCFSRGQKVWMSVTADFDNFSARNDSGEITDDMAISLEVASGELNAIQWLQADKALIAGTAGGEFAIGELNNGDPIAPGNIKADIISGFGSRGIQPLRSGDRSLFVMPSGRKVREIGFDFAQDGFKSKDVTATADHITDGGIIDMDFATEPYSVAWCVRGDGALLGFTWNNEEEVRGWHKHFLGGFGYIGPVEVPWGLVESVAVIPRPNGRGDQVWMSVSRFQTAGFIPGVGLSSQAMRREIVYMEDPYIHGTNAYQFPLQTVRDQFYVDSGITYQGTSTISIGNLWRLESQTVSVLADGAPHPDCVVAGGSIVLQKAATHVQIGLPYKAILKTMRIEAGAADGTAQGKTKRIHNATFRVVGSGSFKVGPDASNLETVEFRKPSDKMDGAVPLFTGDKLVPWDNGYDTDGYIYIQSYQPTALGIAAVFPQVVTQDAR